MIQLKDLLIRRDWAFPAAVMLLATGLYFDSRAVAMDHAEVGAEAAVASAQDRLIEQLTQGIAKQYTGAKITVGPQVHWTRGALSENFRTVSILGESARGEMMFSVTGEEGRRDGEGWVSFSAWMPARVAVKRVHPGDKLTAEMFTVQNVNVAVGQAHALRGVILDPEVQLAGLEARQSVVEGGFLLSTAVQRVPDVRRGEQVRVQLISNGLSLVTQGVAEEPAYIDGQLRVTASKTKRALVGKLLKSGVVEVKL